ncbi:hypothetical protein ElyMa_002008000 [Elysia marginata]|uniref:Secreted protein n=1 Tax=Elysia marginata TaxID=1093978 RepID=A0AAV4F3J8_9GAST|nr:hypothetical protein ElyMa_002008000 [Elysia marginata]
MLTSLRSTFAVNVASVHLCCSAGQVSVLASWRPVGVTWLLRVWIFPASWQHLPEGTCTTNRPLRPSLYQSFTGHESPAFQLTCKAPGASSFPTLDCTVARLSSRDTRRRS